MAELSSLDKLGKLYLWRKRPSEFFREMTGLIPTPNEIQFLDALADLSMRRFLLSAARSTGKTQSMAVGTLWGTYVLPYFLKKPYRVSILSGSLEQSKTLYGYLSDYIRNKTYLLENVIGGVQGVTQTLTKFKGGSWIKALPASERTVLSTHCDMLLIDEAGSEALMDGKLIRDALPLVSPSPYPRVGLGSTPYEFMSYFVEMWTDVKRFSTYRRFGYWAAKDCPWILPEEIAEAKNALSTEEFAIQWLGIPTPLTGTLIDHGDMKECIDHMPNKPGVGPGIIIWGIDYGYTDPTCLVVLQIQSENKTVVLHIQEWRGEQFNKIQDELRTLGEIYPPNTVYADRSHIGENQRLQKAGFPVKEVVFRNDKPLMQGLLRAIFQHRRIKIWEGFQPLIQQLIKYTEKTTKGEDYVDALMMALKKGARMPANVWFFTDRDKEVREPNISERRKYSSDEPGEPLQWQDDDR